MPTGALAAKEWIGEIHMRRFESTHHHDSGTVRQPDSSVPYEVIDP